MGFSVSPKNGPAKHGPLEFESSPDSDLKGVQITFMGRSVIKGIKSRKQAFLLVQQAGKLSLLKLLVCSEI